MKYKAAIMVLLFLPFAYSAVPDISSESSFEAMLEFGYAECFGTSGELSLFCYPFLESFNSTISESGIPPFIMGIFDNKRINLLIRGSSDSYYFFIETGNSQISSISRGNRPGAQIFVETDADVFEEIAGSNDKMGAFVDAVSQGRISYRESGIMGLVKTTIFNIFSFFSGIITGITSP
jgi:hypothetical protein